MKTRPSNPARGFTLVELQIALLIVAAMAALMAGALRLSSKTWTTVNNQQDGVEHRYFLAQYLRRHLSNARFMRVTTEDHGSVTSFFGNEETVNFVAPWPAFHNDGELFWWSIGMEEDEETRQNNLVASYFPYTTGALASFSSDSRILAESNTEALKFDKNGAIYLEEVERKQIAVAEGIEKFELAYFYRDEEGIQKWVKEWEVGSLTPLVIQIKVVLYSGAKEPGSTDNRSGLALPEIVIQPRFADQKLHLQALESGHEQPL